MFHPVLRFLNNGVYCNAADSPLHIVV